MAKRREETINTRISRLVRSAFREAEIGNEATARSFWKSAINSGWEPQPKNVKGFEIAIERGIRDTRR